VASPPSNNDAQMRKIFYSMVVQQLGNFGGKLPKGITYKSLYGRCEVSVYIPLISIRMSKSQWKIGKTSSTVSFRKHMLLRDFELY